jgi:hypothetical protein
MLKNYVIFHIDVNLVQIGSFLFSLRGCNAAQSSGGSAVDEKVLLDSLPPF